ncbi:hypothetical protein BD560DRAFT_426773 [Blakeslea trispora]|nr:hypothetical protein BD560DRAFT_426773 [Blakeslea trispora]
MKDFSPTSPDNLNDPKFMNLTEEDRSVTATQLHRTRLTNIVLRIHQDQRKLAVARSFHKQVWIATEQFLNTVQTVRPNTQPADLSASTNIHFDSSGLSPADDSTSAPSS